MRVPKFTELTPEQKNLYLEVPLHGTTLVSGPPGTGKTVIALLRASEAVKSGRTVVVGMFNQTLRAYVARSEAEFEMPQVETVNRIFREAWYQLRPSPRPSEDLIVLSVPYAENAAAKALGARYTSHLYVPKTRGVWTVSGDRYRQSPDEFARWHPHRQLPFDQNDNRQFDWEQIALGLVSCDATDQSPISWDHLIIDEGQDFPPQFYRAVKRLVAAFGMTLPTERRPSLTVLADENQRLTQGANSTISDIENELKVPPERHFRLEQNFRNTMQIAKVAAAFYCGASSGVPRLPSASGRDAELHRFDSQAAVGEFVRTYAMSNPKHQIGILVADDNRTRVSYFNALKQLMPDRQIHTYESATGKKGADAIPFDERGVILVLNRASCKGLEFDAVFVVDLQTVQVSQASADFFKMGMYVMCSRARSALFLTWVGSPHQSLGVMPLLPDANLLVRKRP